MCSKEEVQVIVDEAETRMEKKLELSHVGLAGSVSDFGDEFTKELNKLYWKAMRWLGIPLLITIVSMTTAWAVQEARIAHIEESMSEGGRYTQEEHDVFSTELERRFKDIEKDLDRILDKLGA